MGLRRICVTAVMAALGCGPGTEARSPYMTNMQEGSKLPVEPPAADDEHLGPVACRDLMIELCHKDTVEVRRRYAEMNDADVGASVENWFNHCVEDHVKADMDSCRDVRCGGKWQRCLDHIANSSEVASCNASQNDC